MASFVIRGFGMRVSCPFDCVRSTIEAISLADFCHVIGKAQCRAAASLTDSVALWAYRWSKRRTDALQVLQR